MKILNHINTTHFYELAFLFDKFNIDKTVANDEKWYDILEWDGEKWTPPDGCGKEVQEVKKQLQVEKTRYLDLFNSPTRKVCDSVFIKNNEKRYQFYKGPINGFLVSKTICESVENVTVSYDFKQSKYIKKDGTKTDVYNPVRQGIYLESEQDPCVSGVRKVFQLMTSEGIVSINDYTPTESEAVRDI